MVRTCAACSLNNSKPSSKKFKLPKDERTATRILRQLGFDSSFEPSTSFRICEKHFTADSFKMWGPNKALNNDPVVKGFEKTELTRDSLRVDDGKRYKLVEAPSQDPRQTKKVMILKEATPPPTPLPVRAKGNKELKAEITKLKAQLRKEKDDCKAMRNELEMLFKKEQKKSGKFSDEFNETVQKILHGTKNRPSARFQSQSEEDSESDSEEESDGPSPKRARKAPTKRTPSSLDIANSVKKEPKYELEEHLFEDETETANQLQEFIEVPKPEAF